MSDEQHHMQIGEVAERTGRSSRTIRYYEQAGLVPPSTRSSGGFRLCTGQDVERLELVKRLKLMDLSVDEMRDLLRTLDGLESGATGPQVVEALRARLAMYRDRHPSVVESTDARRDMPVFRIESQDGQTRTVTAARVVVLGDDVRFQTAVAGQWRLVDTVPLTEVRRVQRRWNEADGRLRWLDEREVNAAAAALAPDDAADPEVAAGPLRRAPGRAEAAERPVPAPPPVVSAADVRCPSCGEQEELRGRRAGGEILLSCLRCGYDGPRVAARRCRTCGGADVVERPQALVERARGTQLSVVGYTTIGLCRVCDADDLARAIEHGGAVLPKELPTVDPKTLQQMRPGGHGSPQ